LVQAQNNPSKQVAEEFANMWLCSKLDSGVYNFELI